MTDDAVAAVVRLEATDAILQQRFGAPINTDNYIGHDVLLFIGLTNSPARQPAMGIGTQSGFGRSVPLSIGGIQADSNFGGTGSRRVLSALNYGNIFATLIPDGQVFVNASVGTNAAIQNVAIADGNEVVTYIKASQDPLAVKDKLQGLETIVLSPDGKQIYGTDYNLKALAVVNTENFTSRQLIKQGDVIDSPFGAFPVDSLNGPTDIVIRADGTTVYVASFSSLSGTNISVFRRNSVTGRLDQQLQTGADRFYLFDRPERRRNETVCDRCTAQCLQHRCRRHLGVCANENRF